MDPGGFTVVNLNLFLSFPIKFSKMINWKYQTPHAEETEARLSVLHNLLPAEELAYINPGR